MSAESAVRDARRDMLLKTAEARVAAHGGPVLASWTQPWGELDPIAFFTEASTEDRALWMRPSTGEALVGVGALRVLTGQGARRFATVSTAWRALLADAVVDEHPGAPSGWGGPLLLGGFSFDPLREPSALWTDYAAARLVLPERMLVVRDGTAWLTTNAIAGPRSTSDVTALELPSFPHSLIKPLPAGEGATVSPAVWKTLAGTLADGIRHGQLGVEKVVLARAHQIRRSTSFDVAAAMNRLAADYPGCTVFAVAHRDACFLGATPERLIALHDGTASTIALAGSVARGATPGQDAALAEQLVRSPKERSEHAIVVDALHEGLAQVCTRVVADARPRVEKLPNVQHLLTRVRGQVAPGVSLLDLVERLHPTPAIGGFPRQRALELIRAYEGLDRGWYGGPVGWLNRDGEGEFVVGIRSALVRGSSATLFAGCGIVADSNPEAEYRESNWKLRPMQAALGEA